MSVRLDGDGDGEAGADWRALWLAEGISSQCHSHAAAPTHSPAMTARATLAVAIAAVVCLAACAVAVPMPSGKVGCTHAHSERRQPGAQQTSGSRHAPHTTSPPSPSPLVIPLHAHATRFDMCAGCAICRCACACAVALAVCALLPVHGQVSSLPLLPEGVSLSSYAGYITVDAPTQSNLFFWLFEAQQVDPSTAPLLVWLNGGPGSSSMSDTGQAAAGVGPGAVGLESAVHFIRVCLI